jgi:hypothetical protein
MKIVKKTKPSKFAYEKSIGQMANQVGRWMKIYNWVAKNPELNWSEKLVVSAILQYRFGKRGKARIAYDTLAEETGLSEDTVGRAVRSLSRKEYLKIYKTYKVEDGQRKTVHEYFEGEELPVDLRDDGFFTVPYHWMSRTELSSSDKGVFTILFHSVKVVGDPRVSHKKVMILTGLSRKKVKDSIKKIVGLQCVVAMKNGRDRDYVLVEGTGSVLRRWVSDYATNVVGLADWQPELVYGEVNKVLVKAG